MRFGRIAIIFLSCLLAACVPVQPERVRIQTFDSLESVYGFLLYRNLILDSADNRKIAGRSSRISETRVSGKDFSILIFDYIRPDKKVGIRWQNGPMYVFLKETDVFSLVGEFRGSRLELFSRDDRVVARVYYHVSASETPYIDYPFENGRFNYIDPSARGDSVFK